MIQPATDLYFAYRAALLKAQCKADLQMNPPEENAKVTLKNKGYSYRTAAPLLGVRFESLCRILNGQFQNKRVLRAIPNLPDSRKETTR